MIASKVTISPETRAKLDNPALSPEKERELRQEMIKDYIRNCTGHAATKQELAAAGGFDPDATSTNYARGIGLIKSMINRGILTHNPTNQFRKTWVVLEDVKTKAPKEAVVETPEVVPSPAEVAAEVTEAPKEAVVELKQFPTLTSIKLVDMAKEFAWRNNSDSLRDFINYIENAIK